MQIDKFIHLQKQERGNVEKCSIKAKKTRNKGEKLKIMNDFRRNLDFYGKSVHSTHQKSVSS